MSTIRMFRINGHDLAKGVQFFCKIENNEGYLLGTICIDDEGLYYYRTGSNILSANESEGTRASFDSFISMEELQELFEALMKVGYSYDPNEAFRFKVSKQGKKIIIEPN